MSSLAHGSRHLFFHKETEYKPVWTQNMCPLFFCSPEMSSCQQNWVFLCTSKIWLSQCGTVLIYISGDSCGLSWVMMNIWACVAKLKQLHDWFSWRVLKTLSEKCPALGWIPLYSLSLLDFKEGCCVYVWINQYNLTSVYSLTCVSWITGKKQTHRILKAQIPSTTLSYCLILCISHWKTK